MASAGCSLWRSRGSLVTSVSLSADVVVMRRRLLTRATTLGRPGLKKCTDNLLGLLDLLADESVDERHW